MEYLIVENNEASYVFNCKNVGLVCVHPEEVMIEHGESGYRFGIRAKHISLQKMTTNCPFLYSKLCELLRKHYVDSVEVVLDGLALPDGYESTVTLTGGNVD